MDPTLIPIIIVPSFFAAVAWMVYVIVDGLRQRQRLRAATEFQGKLLERIGSAQEFGEFLNTSGGARFLDALTIEREGGAHVRILRALQTGLVSLILGIGLFVLMKSGVVGPEGFAATATSATILVSLGAGLLLAAAASYALSRHLGLFDHERSRPHATSASAV